MTMHYVQVFLNEDALVQLEDEFVDKEDDLRHLVYDPIKGIAKAAKMNSLNKQFICNIYDETAPNKQGQETKKLSEYDVDKFDVASDPSWLPENLKDSENIKPYKIRVGDKTWDLLLEYAKYYNARCDVYNKSLPREDREDDSKIAKLADCIEQIFHDAAIGPVMQKINKSIDDELEEEFKQVYESPKDKSAKKKSERSGK